MALILRILSVVLTKSFIPFLFLPNGWTVLVSSYPVLCRLALNKLHSGKLLLSEFALYISCLFFFPACVSLLLDHCTSPKLSLCVKNDILHNEIYLIVNLYIYTCIIASLTNFYSTIKGKQPSKKKETSKKKQPPTKGKESNTPTKGNVSLFRSV